MDRWNNKIMQNLLKMLGVPPGVVALEETHFKNEITFWMLSRLELE